MNIKDIIFKRDPRSVYFVKISTIISNNENGTNTYICDVSFNSDKGRICSMEPIHIVGNDEAYTNAIQLWITKCESVGIVCVSR